MDYEPRIKVTASFRKNYKPSLLFGFRLVLYYKIQFMINTYFIFRFQDTEPTSYDYHVMENNAHNEKSEWKYKSTPFGFVLIIESKLTVRDLHRRYRKQEKKFGVSLPLMILNVSASCFHGESTFFMLRELSNKTIRKRERMKSSLRNVEREVVEPTSDEILDKIALTGIGSINSREKAILDALSQELRNAKKS